MRELLDNIAAWDVFIASATRPEFWNPTGLDGQIVVP